MSEIFGSQSVNTQEPLTADKATLTWGGKLITGAVNISIQYARQVQRRRTIGNKDAIIYATLPVGNISISQLFTNDIKSLFSLSGWEDCGIAPANYITLRLNGGCSDDRFEGITFRCSGIKVSQLSIQSEAEGVVVIGNVGIEFVQLSID